MADAAIQTAIYKLAYDTSNFEAGQKIIASGNEQTIDSFGRLEAKYDEAIRAEQRRTAALAQAARVAEEEGVSEDRLAVHLENVNAKFDAMAMKATMAATVQAQASGQLNSSWSANRGQLLSLQAAGINAFQALASGISLTRVAMTEGAQVIGAFAGFISGPWALAISGGVAALGLLVSQLDIFGSKSKDGTKEADAFGKMQDLIAGKIEKTTGKLSDQSNELDRFMAKLQEFGAAELAVEGERLAAMEQRTASLRGQESAFTAGGRYKPGETPVSAALQQAERDLEAQQTLLDQLAHSATALSKNLSDAAAAEQFLSDTADANAAATSSATKAHAGLSEELKREQEFAKFLEQIHDKLTKRLKAEEEQRRRGNEAIQAQIDAIDAETAMIGLSDDEREVAIDLLRQEEIARRHNVTATDAQRAALIRAAKAHVEAEKAAEEQKSELELLTGQMDDFAKSAADAAFGSKKWKDVWIDAITSVFELLFNELAKLATSGGGIFGSGGLFDFGSIFGGGATGGGDFGGVPPGFAMASGGEGIVMKPTVFVAGESGPERFSFQPMSRPARWANDTGAQPITVSNVFDFRGAMVDEAKIQREILKATPSIVDRSVAAVENGRRRGGREADV